MPEKLEAEKNAPRIVILKNGPYKVHGNVPFVRKTQVVSEYGEPITWKKINVYETGETYILCRCGYSRKKPFCDGYHREIGFIGEETADTQTNEARQYIIPHAVGIVVKKDHYLCMNSGFCANRLTNIDEMAAETAEPRTRAEIIAMIERCPSGSYTYSIPPDEENIEPDLPVQVAATTEITSEGPIEGPLWVTGGIPIERSDGWFFETRNRVTLCGCGHSLEKPLCDGSHRSLQEKALRDLKRTDR